MPLSNLPDPPPRRIVLRFVGYQDPGFVLVTADGTKIDTIENVHEEPDFNALCIEVEDLGYTKLSPTYIDMGLIVLPFERSAA